MNTSNPELHEGLQGQGEHDRGAVGIGGEISIPAPLLPLNFDDFQVVGIALRNKQGHIRHHAIGGGIAGHSHARSGKGRLHSLGILGGQSRKDDISFHLSRIDVDHSHLRDVIGKLALQAPLGGFSVLFA
ncbi:MAG: hypothetical protein CG440_1046, partial [Methanosaeta sp. NSM2]